MSFRKICFLCFLVPILSCTERAEVSKVTFVIPQQRPQKPLNKAEFQTLAVDDFWNPAISPTQTSDLNCFGVIVGGPEAGFKGNRCESVDGTDIFFFGPNKMGILAGVPTELEIPSGANRTFQVIGWEANSNAACATLSPGNNVDADNLSRPFLIGSTTVNLEPGDITVDVNAGFTGSTPLAGCDVFSVAAGAGFTVGGTVSGLSGTVILDLNGTQKSISAMVVLLLTTRSQMVLPTSLVFLQTRPARRAWCPMTVEQFRAVMCLMWL